MIQTENIKQMCEFQTQSILALTVLSTGRYLWEGNQFQAQFWLHSIKPKVFLNVFALIKMLKNQINLLLMLLMKWLGN